MNVGWPAADLLSERFVFETHGTEGGTNKRRDTHRSPSPTAPLPCRPAAPRVLVRARAHPPKPAHYCVERGLCGSWRVLRCPSMDNFAKHITRTRNACHAFFLDTGRRACAPFCTQAAGMTNCPCVKPQYTPTPTQRPLSRILYRVGGRAASAVSLGGLRGVRFCICMAGCVPYQKLALRLTFLFTVCRCPSRPLIVNVH
jgi:hypothetical protein